MEHLYLPLLFLFFTFFSLTSAQSSSSNITQGSSLSTTTNPTLWLSPSGRFAFGFYPNDQGFRIGIWLAGIPEKTVVWTAYRDNPPVSGGSTLLFTNDGRLVIQTGQNLQIPIYNGSFGLAKFASMLDSGNFVLYNSTSHIIWESFKFPTDTLLSGQSLFAGKQLVSGTNESEQSSRRFQLSMQIDGDLVLSPTNTLNSSEDSYWRTNTSDQGSNSSLNLDQNGQLYLRNSTGFFVTNLTSGGFSGNGNQVYRATIDVDGVFRLYIHNFVRNGSSTITNLWSVIPDPCLVKGLCGFNSYCTLMDMNPQCVCPPGFDFINPKQTFQGCARSFLDEDCNQRALNLSSTMFEMDNTVWEDNGYEVLSLMNEDICSRACLGDCYCVVAMFVDGRCSKQMLPLKYGRRNSAEPTKSLIKSGNSNGGLMMLVSVEKGNSNRVVLIVTAVLASFSLIALVVSGFLINRYRIWGYSKVSGQRSYGWTDEITLKSFSYNDLEKATNGFSEEVGRGAFGTVFKGYLKEADRTIAVKKLDRIVEEADREFRTELSVIGKTHHRNLVYLLGFCDEGSNRILVYDFMSNGCLSNFLFKGETKPEWNERVRIAVEIARGILYLHEECETQIIHCDIKPQNILMDDFWVPKISDFGLAKLLEPDETKTFTRIRGTRGYVAPEWNSNLPITVKADVYSFGIVLLETICCRKSVDKEAPEGEVVLCDWVFECFKGGEIGELVGGEEVDEKRLERMVKVGLWCIQDDPCMRPSMKKVILMLEGTVDIPVPPSPCSFISSMIVSSSCRFH